MRTAYRRVAATSALLLVLAGCTPPPPASVPRLTPGGPLEARVGTTVHFQAENLDGAVVWGVDRLIGGSSYSGTVAGGDYHAPDRVPAEPTVTVTAFQTSDPSKSASAKVTVTAPGTMYLLGLSVYVYGDMDTVNGDAGPDRAFKIDGVGAGKAYSDLVVAPSLDAAFVLANTAPTNVFMIHDVSTASGTVSATGLSSLGRENPAAVAYDEVRGILYVAFADALLAYDDASVASDGKEPDRVLEGSFVSAMLLGSPAGIYLDPATDRLFVANSLGEIGTYTNASSVVGNVAPSRLMKLDVPAGFVDDLAYDAVRDELYLSDWTNAAVYVVADASSATGTVAPSRVIGGAQTGFVHPLRAGYDAANDRLVVVDDTANDAKVFDGASLLNGDVAPSRTLGGVLWPVNPPYGLYLDPSR